MRQRTGPGALPSPSRRRDASRLPGFASVWGPLGGCAYLAGVALPWPWDIPLIMLGLCSCLALITGFSRPAVPWSPLTLSLLGFLVVTGLSILVSVDIRRSLHLSTPFLPATLLFFLVREHFQGVWDIRRLYVTLSAVGLGLATMILRAAWAWQAWNIHDEVLREVVLNVGSPLLVVPNDSTLLAVVAPLSFVLLYSDSHTGVRLLASLSLLGTIGAIIVLQSRTAFLTCVLTLVVAAVLLWSRQQWKRGLLYGLALLSLVICIEGSMGFPLAAKFSRMHFNGDGRFPLWSAAWAMFLQAPWLGHGPHSFVLLYKAYLPHSGSLVSARVVPWAHNLYLEILAEQGIIGFLALGSLLSYGLITAYKLQRYASEEIRCLAIGALASLVGFGLAALVELSLLRLWVVVMLFLLLGVLVHLSLLHDRRKEMYK